MFRVIATDQPQTLDIDLGSDDGLAVWLNGKHVLANNVARGAAPDQDQAALTLQSGENRLLLKVFNQGGGHSFYFQAGHTHPPQVWRHIERDFPLQARWMSQHLGDKHLAWFTTRETANLERELLESALRDLGQHGDLFRGEFEILFRTVAASEDLRFLELCKRICRFRYRPEEAKTMNLAALRRAIEDLASTFLR